MYRIIILFLSLTLVSSACMTFPQNGTTLKNINDEMVVVGAVPNPGVNIQLAYVDLTAQVEGTIASFQAAAEPNEAAGGWYLWGGRVKLDNFDKWQQIPNQRKLYMRLVALSPNPQNPQEPGKLVTFDANSYGECHQANKAGGPGEIIKNCKSNASPIVVVYAECGGSGQVCCKTSLNSTPCDGSLTCVDANHTCMSETTVTTNDGFNDGIIGQLIGLGDQTISLNVDGTIDDGAVKSLFLGDGEAILNTGDWFDHKLPINPWEPADFYGHKIGI
jgi:hypothetical protein